ncbi:FtsK/SpoIIIE domain-containing protein [uncultured Microbacterium sp.]|uniref:FtsK/SpoIIIE domain-containing protein n=1 Tax=uncultured Microbacterium sp. TaxID=191216 RepID=UPI0025DE6508|nr:FtsK/SpoIIIE domain-containing protein [uncultured Microbacterium sp.]
MDPADPIVLPSPSEPGQSAPLPLLAAVVPIVTGVVLFAVTRSPLSLCFAAVGPVMILGAFVDGVRRRRRAARRERAQEQTAWARIERVTTERTDAERERLLRASPDVASCLREAPMRGAGIEDGILLTLGRGDVPSPLRFTGTGDRAEAFRASHAAIPDAPVTAALDRGVCLRGPFPIVVAVARALLLQLVLRHAPGAIRAEGDGVDALGLDGLDTREGHSAVAVHVGRSSSAAIGPRIALLLPGQTAPPGYETIVDVTEPRFAEVRSSRGTRRCRVEAVSAEQGSALLRQQGEPRRIPLALGLGQAGVGAPPAAGSLGVALGRDADGPVVVDLLGDGPHALVTGVTGAGKSELLVSWVTALCASRSATEVSFVLADFKGGTAFDRLRGLPHVAAVITDLDAAGAERGVRSLRAELRRRESVLAERGARSLDEADGALTRLVIVVDEFAALLHEHPDLASVFTDIAARGRALGLHLVLGTQRATGVVRDALATNCPLRIALRVTDPADSRAMIGTDGAAALPGDGLGRGLALLRRPQDAVPVMFRVALTTTKELEEVIASTAAQPRARSPWMPSLPRRVTRRELTSARGVLVLGLADEPERQRQVLRVLRPGDRGVAVLGGPGSGKTTVLSALAAQVDDSLWVPGELERAWSVIAELDDGERPWPSLLLVDDVDRILAGFPLEYASLWAERLQRILRRMAEQERLVAMSAGRCSGAVATLVELLPQRGVLRTVGRAEHLALGGAAASFDPDRPDGRAVFGTTEVQCVLPDDDAGQVRGDAAHGRTPLWEPRASLVGVVSGTPTRTSGQLSARFGSAVQVLAEGDPLLLVEGRALSDELVVLVGDPDAWQRRFALWQRVQRTGEIVVLAEAGRELRTLAGVRELPPYADPFAARAWTVDEEGRPVRVRLVAEPAAGRGNPG